MSDPKFPTDRDVELISRDGGALPRQLDAQLPEPLKLAIVSVFNLLEAAYLGQFKSVMGDVDKRKFTLRAWAFLLRDIPEQWITEAAVQLCRESEYIPSVHRVRQRALMIGSGAPDIDDAFAEACHRAHDPEDRSWSHPVVHRAVHSTGIWELTNLPADEVRTRFEANFWKALEQHHESHAGKKLGRG
ncbi:MAG: hypothetical protein ISN29_11940 [Gammaproteobacteria bacterium AqS3]|nr:hypothetical protein [Gammaproteobacteria bacterium AqS3]